jgi:hypothetical protein
MLLSLLLISLITAGGLALTYIISDDEPLMWRLASGCVIGSAVFGTVGFVLANFAGLSIATAVIMFAVILLPLLIFRGKDRKRALAADWNRAKNRLQGKSFRRLLPFVYYAFFFLLFLFFFERTMFLKDGGIFTGGSNNLGDLPFHLGAIFSFTEGANFPPENPNFAGARFTYPFVADLITAYFVKLGANVKDAMLVQNVAWAFSLLVVLERFVFKLVNDRLAARIAPFLLFLSGGLGFIWFFSDYTAQAKGFFEFLSALPKDYTIGPDFKWGNSLTTLFMTQRSLLLGMPITLVVLGFLWRIFATEDTEKTKGTVDTDRAQFPLPYVFVGILAGLLPLIHLHSLFVLFVVGAFCLVIKPTYWRELMSFAGGVCVIAVPELIWSMSGSATEASEFISRHFGWDAGQNNIFWFWIKNTGIFIPLLAAGIYLICYPERHKDAKEEISKKDKGKAKKQDERLSPNSSSVLFFYVPFILIFVLSNLFKFAPWEWDNIKLLIYWWVGSIPLVAYGLAFLWRSVTPLKIVAGIFVVVLTLSGSIDVFRIVSGQINFGVFDKDAVEIANDIRTRTPANAVVLNAPTYNTATVLSGRVSLLRYPGHLSSHGIKYLERLGDAKAIYSGAPNTDLLIEKYGIDYLLLGPEVQNFARESSFTVNEEYFKKYQLLVQTPRYKVYRVR